MAKHHHSSTQAVGVVASAILCGRVAGLVRELTLASLFGAGRSMDAFLTAFRAPNLLRDLFAEGALSTAFVTLFSRKMAKEGKKSAWLLASRVVIWATVFMSTVVLLGMAGAQFIIGVLAPGFPEEKAQLTVLLCRIMFPFILLVSLAALVTGMLNVSNVFGVPAIASSFFNLGFIGAGVFLSWMLDPSFSEKSLVGLAIGILIGGILQLIVQLSPLRKAGFSFCPVRLCTWRRDSDLRAILALMAPATLAAGAVQVNVMVNSIFASWLEDGTISWLTCAFRLMQFPLGVFGMAVATVTLPTVSKLAADRETVLLRETLAKAMRLSVFLTLPSAVGLIFLSTPIVSLVYQHGKFCLDDTLHTTIALQFYALGLVSYSCTKVLSPAFYALDCKWEPAFVSFLSIGLNFLLNWFLIFQFGLGYRGLALSTALSACFNFGALYCRMRLYTGGLESSQFISTILRTLVSALIMAIVCWGLTHLGNRWIFSPHLWIRGVSLLTIIFAAGSCYLGVCWVLRMEETRFVHICMRITCR
ncbi:putative peptidoglycan biosynthesis protein MurJ [Candidatus Xiphinematobacter sp. Idaho Grape]|uniref:murein biosynthesis integral membrane protein MurJ n=1 Tax=Candidatus Xiphinematobacter sp. Idaho Grape TaxID=1704307 RepID=UPI0007064076|nr:murein biosynthesis integral membrane protein MurJ [Candidatus Xiphinematobacter sp. Idaho Grape]ALJ56910.1 putative peptidoglycan biosynthesis protein MurJ [Candidatus Xiphinematobacter sp. Idaho Grape]